MKKQFKYFLEDHKNKIQAFFEKSTNIEILDGSCDRLNRYKHAGAQLLVDGVYYYFTTSQFNMANHLYVSLNKGLFEKIKTNQDPYKVVLINRNNFTIFDKWNIIEDNIISNYKNKIPLVSLDYAESIWPLRMLQSTLSFEKLQAVRYSWEDKKNNKFHAKKIRIYATEYKYDRTFNSIVQAYTALTGTKISKETHRPVGKPVSNAAYKKSYKSFIRDIKAERLLLINNKGIAFQAIAKLVDTDKVSTTSILYININNIEDVDTSKQASRVTKNRNTENSVASRKMDKQLGILADKMAENVKTMTEKEIKLAVINIGNNENMLQVFVESLHERGFDKEAVYAIKVFDALNNI